MSLTQFRYSMVWDETASIYFEMCSAEGWDVMQTVNIPIVNDLTMKVAYCLSSIPSYTQVEHLHLGRAHSSYKVCIRPASALEYVRGNDRCASVGRSPHHRF
jgi:hypothetical protein